VKKRHQSYHTTHPVESKLGHRMKRQVSSDAVTDDNGGLSRFVGATSINVFAHVRLLLIQ
jgi:hypothetical protein